MEKEENTEAILEIGGLGISDKVVLVKFSDLEEHLRNVEESRGTQEECVDEALSTVLEIMTYHRTYEEVDGEPCLVLDKQSLLNTVLYEALSVAEKASEDQFTAEEGDQ